MKQHRIQALARSFVVGVAVLAIGACGKGGSDGDGAGSAGKPVGSGSSGGAALPVGSGGKAPIKAVSRGPERGVYSLVDNRLSAHLLRNGGLTLAAGSAGFAKYVRFGNPIRSTKRSWELRQQQGEVKVGRLTGTSGKVMVPLTADDVGSPQVQVRAFNGKAAARAFSLRVNGSPDISAQLAPGWSTVSFAVPAGKLREGENELVFFVGGGAGLDVEWIQVGGAPAPEGKASTAFYNAAAKSLVLPSGGGLAYYVTIPEKGVVTGDLADGSCEIAVTATAEDGTLAEGKLAGLGSAVALGNLAGKAVRLELVAGGCSEARFANAALAIPGELPKAARGEAPKYVVFFIMDSLRADRLRPWNPKARPEVPTLEKLAETSAVFLQAYVQGNESQVSHASIWTSLYPVKHKKLGEKQVLDGKWKTIDEVAKGTGKFVAGASGNGYIRPTRGFGTGWDKFSNHIEEEAGLRAEDLLAKGLSFIEGKKEPWFLYLGTIDTHVSWRAKEPWISKLDPGYKGRFADTFSGGDASKSASLGLTEREKDHIRALYDSNVSYQDEILRQLIEKLQAAGIWEQTMLILHADHGDEQWEDGRVGHGASERDMLIHVPLLIHYPPLLAAGKYSEGTESVDITPTVADALGAASDPEWQGESLIPLTQGIGLGYPRLSFNSMYEDSHAGRMGHWKVRTSGAGTTKIFDLRDGALEHDEAPPAAAAIGGRMVLDALWILRQWNLEWKKSQWGNPANVSPRFAVDLGE